MLNIDTKPPLLYAGQLRACRTGWHPVPENGSQSPIGPTPNPFSELHRAGQLHGIPSADCQDKLGGLAYADDQNALSSLSEGLKPLTAIMQCCLAEDLLLHLAVHKCQAMCFHPRGT
jgi:hypothetical protein